MDISAHKIMNNIAVSSNMLMEVSGETREELKRTLVGMLQDIHDVCVRHNIEYCLSGGSALGAIRHKGFIPWDDDLDIMMLRNDYERFKSVFEQELGRKYIFEAANYMDVDSKTAFPKIHKRNTNLWEVQDVASPYARGIFVDIFVFENISKYKFIRRIDAVISNFMKGVGTSMIMYRYPNKVMDKYFASTRKTWLYYKMRRLQGFLFSFISHKTWINLYDKFISRHKQPTSEVTTPAGRKKYLGEIIPRKWLSPVKLGRFEGRDFYIPAQADNYLRNLYGDDYMQLPPVEKRERHFVVKLSFGE